MMVYTGAAGDTAKELGRRLHLPTRILIPEQINAGVAKITASLAGDPEKQGYELHVANGLWGQQGYPWLPKFLDTLAGSYAAKFNKVDYQNNPDPSRRQINDWVAQQTHDKIKDLIPAGAITSSTRMVLANAIYMKALVDLSASKGKHRQTGISPVSRQISGRGHDASNRPFQIRRISRLAGG